MKNHKGVVREDLREPTKRRTKVTLYPKSGMATAEKKAGEYEDNIGNSMEMRRLTLASACSRRAKGS